jgi:hypothetical protein
MAIEVEVRLRIPNNRHVRFVRRIQVASLPKVREALLLTTQDGPPMVGTVTRLDWHERKNIFVVACTYRERSVTIAEQEALLADPDWTRSERP